MSQMCKSEGLLNEEELKDYINNAFELKLTKEAFTKPTQELICEIYGKFLDEFKSDWREQIPDNDSYEANLMLKTYEWVKRIVKKYDDIGMCYQDILLPERKRTSYFLNYLVYFRLQLTEIVIPAWNKACEQRSERQAEIQRVKQNIERLKSRREELALKSANLEPLEVLELQLREARERFETEKRKGEELAALGQQKKVYNQKLSAELAKETEEYEASERLRLKADSFLDMCEAFAKISHENTPESVRIRCKLSEKLEDLKREHAGMNKMNKTFEGEEHAKRALDKKLFDRVGSMIVKHEKRVAMILELENEKQAERETDVRLKASHGEDVNIAQNHLDFKFKYANSIGELEQNNKQIEISSKTAIEEAQEKINKLKAYNEENKQRFEKNILEKRQKIRQLTNWTEKSEMLGTKLLRAHEEAERKLKEKLESMPETPEFC